MEVFAKTSQSVSKQCLIKVHQYVTRTMSDENSNVADEDVAHNTIEVRVINHLTGEEQGLKFYTRPHQLMRQSSSMLRNTSMSYSIASQGDYCFPISFALIDCEIHMI